MSLLSLEIRHLRRLVVFVIGMTMLLLGILMFLTVGPGTLVIVAALGVLAIEFVWARHLLTKAKSLAAMLRRSKKSGPLPGGQTDALAPGAHEER